MPTYWEVERRFEGLNADNILATLSNACKAVQYLETQLSGLTEEQMGAPASEEVVAAMDALSQLAAVMVPIQPAGGCLFPRGTCA